VQCERTAGPHATKRELALHEWQINLMRTREKLQTPLEPPIIANDTLDGCNRPGPGRVGFIQQNKMQEAYTKLKTKGQLYCAKHT
jgi:hypothetical protein